MEAKDKHWEELVKYFRGKANEQEIEKIRIWREKSDLNKKAFQEFSRIWRSIRESESDNTFDAVRGWRQFSQFYDRKKTEKQKQQQKKYFLTASRYVAAIFVGVFLSTGISHLFLKNNPAVTQPLLVEVPNSQRSTVTLFDGTEVVLNSGSHLEYMPNDKKERHIKLSGEAYFSVTKDPKRPFIVETDNFSVKVLGTVFNVKSYKSEEQTSTLLLKGSVVLMLPGKQNILLSPNEQAHVMKNGKVKVEKISNAEKYVAWREGKYYFEREKLGSISQMLERAFDVDVVFINEAIKNERYTGSLDVDEHVRDVMERLALTSSFILNYKIEGRKVYIGKQQ
jgi:transmembrane sensor